MKLSIKNTVHNREPEVFLELIPSTQLNSDEPCLDLVFTNTDGYTTTLAEFAVNTEGRLSARLIIVTDEEVSTSHDGRMSVLRG